MKTAGTATMVTAAAMVFAAGASAQRLVLTSPRDAVQVRSGDDFASSVLGNAWDMDRLRDIGADYNFLNPVVQNGVWQGTGLGGLPYFYVLNPGFMTPHYTNYPSFYDGGTRYGPLNPINAGKYRRVALRLAMPREARSWLAVFWATRPFTWATHGMNVLDGYASPDQTGRLVIVPWDSGYRIYDIDLTGAGWLEDRGQALAVPPGRWGASWSGTVYGLQVMPTAVNLAPGRRLDVDWIRLYDPQTSPTVTVQWASDGIPDDPYHTLQLFVDRDATGYNGDLLMSEIRNDGSLVLRTAALPPGVYYLYLRAVKHENGGLTEVARSGYSAAIRIGAPPSVAFQAPTFTSGDDYATTELGNPWDMSDAADLQQTLGISDAQFGNGLFTATANGSAAGPTGGDPMMYLNLKRDGVTVPITPQRYRYLSFRLAADPAGTLNLLDRLQKGFDTRVTWWNKGLTTDGTYSKPVLNLEGWRTYSVDLSDPTFAENGPNAGGLPQWGWTRLNAVTTFRFDPIEPTMRVRFWVDDIKLCAPNAPSMLGVYRIAWQAQDPDSSLLTVTLYRGTKVGGVYREHATPIARLTQAPGNGSYLWHTAGVPNGEHYIRVRVSDGTHAVSMVSDVPVAIPGVARGNPGAVPVSGDYDGDGWADLAVYHRSTGRWFVRPLGAKAPVVFDVPWGGPGTVPVPGDYDGDGADDLAVYDTATGNWYIRRATRPALICFGQNWGGPGTMPVPGDYDGDGADDLAVYDAATGNWYIRRAARPVVICFGQNWGGPGMAPVPGDYDGDGADDLAVYDTATGNWYVRKAVRPVAICFGQNWGGPTLVPVPGDYDGDGPCDLAVFDRLTGKWYVRRLGPKTPAICFGQNWGAAGFTPVPGDYTGDAANDLCVFSDAAGTWYIRSLADPDEPPVTFGERWGW